ncbi:MAG TPA: type III-A CRISPR-associated protein Cas10/Csm1 [Symbiobacteriaceae bacterium]|nr:type III-A CRISPR-associated protein Cas10/Csm1 [Symbiobacteriaceae bacterium]
MHLAHEATMAVLTDALLALAAPAPDAAARLRRRLAEASPTALAAATQARTLVGDVGPCLTEPFESPFSLINRGPATPPLHLLPQPLTMRPDYPIAGTVDADTLRPKAQRLQADLRSDLERAHADPNALLFLLEQYGWAVSAGAPGLSFADVARLTAAVAGALTHGPDQLLLISADLSGVQSFIYTISAKGALRTLRARSFYLELITEEVARRLLERIGLTRANLIYAGGGHLFMLAPDLPAVHAAVAAVQAELNAWLLKSMDGKVALALGAAPCPFAQVAVGAEGAPEIWRQATAQVSQVKAARFRASAAGSEFWEARELGAATCDICHCQSDDPRTIEVDTGAEPIEACPLCWQLHRLGGRLPKARYVAVTPSGAGAHVVIDGTGFHVCETTADVQALAEKQTVLAINALSVAELAVGPGAYPLWLGSYTYRSEDSRTQATFEDLAKAAVGKDLIGVLRMDVDRLGQLFSGGLPQGYRDFARTAGLSGALTRFFKLHINSICEGERVMG